MNLQVHLKTANDAKGELLESGNGSELNPDTRQ
jgi:hypothetical protein